jgi:tRNA A-37 threonylcarbamoyl transferase component Bud32
VTDEARRPAPVGDAPRGPSPVGGVPAASATATPIDWRAERGEFPTAKPPSLVLDASPVLASELAERGDDDDAARGDGPTRVDPVAPEHVDDARRVSSDRHPAPGFSAPTRVGREPARPLPPRSTTTIADSTARLLDELEATRALVFFRVLAVVALLVVCALPILPGPTWLRAQTAALSATAGVLALGVAHLAREPARYTPRLAAASGVGLSLLAVGVMYFLGLFSAAATLLSLGIYFFGSSQSRTVARGVYAACAGAYFVLTAAMAIDVLPDLGVFSASAVPRNSRLYRVGMQQVLFAMTFYLARSSRKATQLAFEKAREADRELRQREAQLYEARLELDRALHQKEGRLTGKRLGEYEVGVRLGRGGMGEVYQARHARSGDEVAIKLLHSNMLEDPKHVERFLREARATAAVPSEHVPALLDVGAASDGAPFLVMELLEGHDLAWYLRRTPKLPLVQVVELVEHTARALAAVREAGVVHRDLKPANLFLTDTLPRRWKVLDFGLSKLQGASSLTKDQALGTPSYMAPEQVRGREVDHQSDLYALASIAYRALTGRAPFVGDEIAKVLLDVLTRVPDGPGGFAKVPMDVELVLAIGLAKRRRDRFATVEEFARAIRLAERGELDDETRQRGWSLLKQYPWGSVIRKR